MSYYKKLSKKDISSYSFKAYKEWSLNQSSDYVTTKLFASASFIKGESDDWQQSLNWHFLKTNFYMSSSEAEGNKHRVNSVTVEKDSNNNKKVTKDISDPNHQHHRLTFYKPHLLDLDYEQHLNKFGKPWPTGSLINISQKLYGNRIVPGSFTMTDKSTSDTITLKDDTHGNLYAVNPPISQSNDSPSSSNNHIGNIFYHYGLAVIKETSSFSSGNYYSRVGTGDWKIKFKSEVDTTTWEYTINSKPNEFNNSFNSTMDKYSYKGDTYITTVTLYDKNKIPLVVGKLSQPVKKSKKIPIIFKIRFDY